MMDHATMARHANSEKAINPRAAPTPINTVPSGTLDCCIYGAFDVGGTVAVGIGMEVESDILGRPVPVDVESAADVVSPGRPVSCPLAWPDAIRIARRK